MNYYFFFSCCVYGLLTICRSTTASLIYSSYVDKNLDDLTSNSEEFEVPRFNTSTCDTLNSLAQALYDAKDNILKLTRAFYPPQRTGVSFLKVTYQFENGTGHLDGCDATYVWAKGGFLAVQPPSIFQFTSLFFSHNVSDDITLRLPWSCRHLVKYNDSIVNDSKCSCHAQSEDILFLLTHQVFTL